MLIFSDYYHENSVFFPAAFRVPIFSEANGVYLCWVNDAADFSSLETSVANGYVEYGKDGSANFFRQTEDGYIRIFAEFCSVHALHVVVEFFGRDLQYQVEAYLNIFDGVDMTKIRELGDVAFAIAMRTSVAQSVIAIIKKRLCMVVMPIRTQHWFFLSPMEYHEDTMRQFALLEHIVPIRAR